MKNTAKKILNRDRFMNRQGTKENPIGGTFVKICGSEWREEFPSVTPDSTIGKKSE